MSLTPEREKELRDDNGGVNGCGGCSDLLEALDEARAERDFAANTLEVREEEIDIYRKDAESARRMYTRILRGPGRLGQGGGDAMSKERIAGLRSLAYMTKNDLDDTRLTIEVADLRALLAEVDALTEERDEFVRDMPKVVAGAAGEARSKMRHDVARYLIDRADQYETSCAAWAGLADAAKAMVDGDFDAAVGHGELDDDDLIHRVDAMARTARQPLGCRDPECPCKEPPESSRPPESTP